MTIPLIKLHSQGQMYFGTDKPIAKRSPWPFTIAAGLFFVLTFYLLYLYNIAHWQIPKATLRVRMETHMIFQNSLADSNVPSSQETREQSFRRALDDLDDLRSKTSKIRDLLEVYHLTGLMAFLCSIISIMHKPRSVGILGLVFGVAGLILAAVIM